ncbi:MAG: hypothetical protein JO148_01560 [Acidimicrobiia bacterium]|nr:hypothetical protein [Acidimicrobiia bacterium]
MERTESSNASANRRRIVTIAVVAALALLGGAGAAIAQTSGGSSTSTPSPTVPGQNGPGGPRGPMGHFRGGPGFGPGGGPGGAIHGEFVQPDGSGGYRTVDEQVGDVTSVSSDSISVKSADGFSKTYSVDQNTAVNSGRDGIANVKNGDKVSVNAVVTDGKAAARSVQDLTTLGQIRQHWNPQSTSTTIS